MNSKGVIKGVKSGTATITAKVVQNKKTYYVELRTKVKDLKKEWYKEFLKYNNKAKIYINKNAFGKKVEFNITTNATLLTENIVDFLVENNFQILVSLDGPKETHDLSRQFAGSDEGCFNKLMDNLKFFQLKYPEFYKNRVSFNSVILTDNH